jgi:hypothetical protein
MIGLDEEIDLSQPYKIEVDCPPTLPSPTPIGSYFPKSMNFDITFDISKKLGITDQVEVYIVSLSQGVAFVFPEETFGKEGWLRRRKKVEHPLSLDRSIVQMVGRETVPFVFPSLYVPNKAIKTYVWAKRIELRYYLKDATRAYGPNQLTIGFEEHGGSHLGSDV